MTKKKQKIDCFLRIASPQLGNLRFSGPPSGQCSSPQRQTGPADLKADSLSTVPSTLLKKTKEKKKKETDKYSITWTSETKKGKRKRKDVLSP
ncbi:hypothetical protein PoB_002982500 [Plakobranchus ocellatus]|uniref:Uncharacterized protein n=1 Tax=Plakobranchus ocellatus TaxID=259542 RepID=A0AAV4A7F7_9GAST|nr:hypothetical protein PoB_002982500 [Plakobranchus ocellatus]